MAFKTCKRITFLFGFLFIFLYLHCGLIEPTDKCASIVIKLEKSESINLSKTTGTLDQMRCIVKKGENTVYDKTVNASGGQFRCEINGLEPGSGYSVLVYGMESGSVVARASRENITLSEGETKQVSITWNQFQPILVSPSNTSTISDSTPTFEWLDVSGAVLYELQVDNSSSFTSPEIYQSSLTSSTYTSSSSLSDGTYYWRVRCQDSQGNWGWWSSVCSFTIETVTTGTVTDIDGNVYKTVKNGNQWWMAENLKVIRYRNGDPIPNVTDNTEWSNLAGGARCAYNNDENNVATYGRLYNWYAVNDNRNIAPAGWHVPTDEDWQTLVDYLGGDGIAGGKLKETGTVHWRSPNTGASNESGFSALPGGFCNYDNGNFISIGSYATFWSSTEGDPDGGWGLYLSYDSSEVFRSNYYRRHGFSVRCVRDN